ncbi:MAG: hypothetical protein HUJ27_04695 [Rhodobacteraceae bacterium]|nr:hypothetical protein [Paracoccaceae bacterium]
MSQRWFWRMARWARRPPSEARVKLVLMVIALCVVLFGIEWLFGWPEFLTVEKVRLR